MIYLYNTLERKKQKFKSIKPKEVKIYTCGPTVYDYAHIGNLRAYVFADVLKRVLKYNNYKVRQVMNITDVGHLVSDADEGEDKMMKALRREGLKPSVDSMLKLADGYTKEFKKDLKNLNILEPDKWCQATKHVKEIVDFIERIEKAGYTYQTSDGLYFDTSKYKDYSQLARLKIKGLRAGARVKLAKEKKNPADFALWIQAIGKQKNHIMQWDSPWGKGFPGWHIECSAMSIKHLGNKFDIHTGGIDHVPIHHTNERAQNYGCFGKSVVTFWMHNEFVVLKGSAKMAKSAGNFLTLNSIIEKNINPLAYRYFLLGTHYRKKIEFSWEALQNAQNSLEKLYNLFFEIKKTKDRETTRGCNPLSECSRGGAVKKGTRGCNPLSECSRGGAVKKGTRGCSPLSEKRFAEAVNDDLDTPQALAIAWQVIKDKKLSAYEKYQLLIKFDQVLGLEFDKFKPRKVKISKDLQKLLDKRQKARKQKDWKTSDKLRSEIKRKYDVVIEDTSEGQKVRKV